LVKSQEKTISRLSRVLSQRKIANLAKPKILRFSAKVNCMNRAAKPSYSRKMKTAKKPKSISLFSGAMGLDLGLEMAGFETAVAVEINPVAARTIAFNKPSLPVINKPIQEVTSQEILDTIGLKKGEVDLICGGPCCQSFSTAGKRKSISDQKRGKLFFDFKRMITEIRPRFFIMENVKGILSAAITHRPLNRRGPGFPKLKKEEQFGSALELICKELSSTGYLVTYGLLNCADYGVPQKRYRVVFIGSRDWEPITMPTPTHSKEQTDNLPAWVTLKKALADRKVSKHDYLEFRPKILNLLKLLSTGQNWRDLPTRLHRKALGAAFDSWGGRSGFCRRLTWGDPAPTLVTSPNGNATCLCHPTEDRPLSVQEYAILQQFPDDWKITGSITQQYLQIGNAVPVGLGDALGKMLLKLMKKNSVQLRKRKGSVSSADPKLDIWLKKRPKTQLNPPHMRRIKSLERAKEWLKAA
jgi:DNA (cytosine-5)-methyltransferase 1